MISLETLLLYKFNYIFSEEIPIYLERKKFILKEDLIFIGYQVKSLKKKDLTYKELKKEIENIVSYISNYNLVYGYPYISRGRAPKTSTERKLNILSGLVNGFRDQRSSILGSTCSTIAFPIEETYRIIYQLYIDEYFTVENVSFFVNNRIWINLHAFTIWKQKLDYRIYIYNRYDKDVLYCWNRLGYEIKTQPVFKFTNKIEKNLLSEGIKSLTNIGLYRKNNYIETFSEASATIG